MVFELFLYCVTVQAKKLLLKLYLSEMLTII